MYAQLSAYNLGDRSEDDKMDAAAGYMHYIHGINPLGKVYLSNMSSFGAERSVDEFYHTWFLDQSDWDNVNNSFGPPPGFLVGGPNYTYSGSLNLANQPDMKKYADSNSIANGENSWEISENSNGYQIEYLRLLSNFVD